MILDDILEGINKLISLLKSISPKIGVTDNSEDMILQYPNNSSQMLLEGGMSVNTLNRRINRKLKSLSVYVPQNGVMTIVNNNVTLMFLSEESGTITFDNGIMINDIIVTLTNTGSSPARFNYKMVFGD